MYSYQRSSQLSKHNDTYDYIHPTKYAGKLKGKTVLITGASRGIGRASAVAFASAGADLALIARDQSKLDSVAAEIQAKHPRHRVVTIAGDVREPAFPARAVTQALQSLEVSGIDVLVNNAGIHRLVPFWHETDNDLSAWWNVVETNLRGGVAFTQACLQRGGMLARRAGQIITCGSNQGFESYPGSSAYGAAKSGLLRFHHNLELETRRFGIVNYYVYPGTVPTDMILNMQRDMSAEAKAELSATPERVRFFGSMTKMELQTAELGANTFVALCCEDEARYMSGKYIEAEQDLGELLAEARKGASGRIEQEGLYVQKLEELWD